MIKGILAIDPGSKSTGWALFVNGEYYKSGSIFSIERKTTIQRRLHDIREEYVSIKNKIKEKEIELIAVYLEKLNHRTHYYTIFSSGVITEAFWEVPIVYDMVPATQWKKYHGFKPKDKGFVINEYFKKQYPNVITSSDDEVEAILMGEYLIKEYLKDDTTEENNSSNSKSNLGRLSPSNKRRGRVLSTTSKCKNKNRGRSKRGIRTNK
jgi:hypothetical protein